MGRPLGCRWVQRCSERPTGWPLRVVLVRWNVPGETWHAYTLNSEGLPVSTIHNGLASAFEAYPGYQLRYGYAALPSRDLVDALKGHGCAWRCLRVACASDVEHVA